MNLLLTAASSWDRFFIWLPALVFGTGLVLGCTILLCRAFVQSLREFGHPRWLAAGAVLLLAAVVVLTYLGVSLPRE